MGLISAVFQCDFIRSPHFCKTDSGFSGRNERKTFVVHSRDRDRIRILRYLLLIAGIVLITSGKSRKQDDRDKKIEYPFHIIYTF